MRLTRGVLTLFNFWVGKDGPKVKDDPVVSNYRRVMNVDRKPSKAIEQAPVGKTRVERWKITGVVALSESNLKVSLLNLNDIFLQI